MSADIEWALLKSFRKITPKALYMLVDFADYLSCGYPVVASSVFEHPL